MDSLFIRVPVQPKQCFSMFYHYVVGFVKYILHDFDWKQVFSPRIELLKPGVLSSSTNVLVGIQQVYQKVKALPLSFQTQLQCCLAPALLWCWSRLLCQHQLQYRSFNSLWTLNRNSGYIPCRFYSSCLFSFCR